MINLIKKTRLKNIVLKKNNTVMFSEKCDEDNYLAKTISTQPTCVYN